MTPYIETDCTIEHEGRTFTSGGAIVTPERIVAYVGKVIPGSGIGIGGMHRPRRELTDWHGRPIGTCYVSATWKTPRSHVSSTLSQIYAMVQGVTYTGRGAGEGAIFQGKRCK